MCLLGVKQNSPFQSVLFDNKITEETGHCVSADEFILAELQNETVFVSSANWIGTRTVTKTDRKENNVSDAEGMLFIK